MLEYRVETENAAGQTGFTKQYVLLKRFASLALHSGFSDCSDIACANIYWIRQFMPGGFFVQVANIELPSWAASVAANFNKDLLPATCKACAGCMKKNVT
jgi:hypothetical protein